MSVILSSITGQTAEATVKLGSIPVHFVYKPYAMTLGMSMRLANPDSKTDMTEVLAQVLESWDVEEEEGVEFPPTAENLDKIPTELATLMAQAVVGGGGDVVGEAASNSDGG